MTPEITATDGSARTATDLATTVRGILARYLGRSVDEVLLESRLEHDLELDSFAMIEITVALEAALGFSMDDAADPHDLKLATVADLVTYIDGRVVAQRQPEERGDASSNDRRA